MSAAEPVRHQRVAGLGRLDAAVTAGRTRVARLREEGAAKIRMPASRGDPLEAVLINTAGGMTGGDRLRWELRAASGSALIATTQACEKAYRAGDGHAEVAVALTAGEGARLAWLPQETILFDRSALHRRLDVDLAEDARALIMEAVVFGRSAMGESVTCGLFRDDWRVRVGRSLVHAEAFQIGPDIAGTLSRKAALSGRIAMATILLVSPDAEKFVASARRIVGDAGGVSHWNVGPSGKLLARLLAGDGYALRQRLVPLIRLLNDDAALPKVWSI